MTSVGKSIKTIIAAALASAALASLSAGSAMAQSKDQLIVGQLQFLTNFHPLVQVNNTKRLVINYSLRPMTAFDENVVNHCILCETLPTIENGMAKIVDLPGGKKGMKVTLKLRERLAWGDGVPVTSKDVEFTCATQTYVQLGTPSPLRGRVLSVHGLIFRASPSLGALVLGVGSDVLGLRTPVVCSAVAMGAISLALFSKASQIAFSPNDSRHPPPGRPAS